LQRQIHEEAEVSSIWWRRLSGVERKHGNIYSN
jgi:hypothetical protein